MARSVFGGRPGDTVASLFSIGNRHLIGLPVDANGDPASVVLTVWDEPDGTQFTNLRAADGTTVITQVVVPTTGQIPEFYGPDGVNVAVYVKDPDGDYQRMDARADDAAAAAVDAADRAEEAATAVEGVVATSAGVMATVDANPASTYRVQQDARLTASYVGAIVVTGPGIDPTGTTDSTTAIQAKLSAASSGQRVFLPRGTYKHTGLTVPGGGAIFEGEGAATALNYVGTVGTAPAVLVGSGSKLRNVKTYDARTFAGIPVTVNGVSFATSAADATVEGCTVYGFRSAGIASLDGNRLRVVNNHVYNIGDKASLAGDGILIYRGTGSIISGNYVHDAGKHGISCTGDGFGRGGAVTISDNVSVDNGDCGIIATKTDSVTVTGNVTDNNGQALTEGAATGGAGIQVTDCLDATVTGNASSGSTENGIVVQAAAGRVTIGSNTVEGNQHENIKVWAAEVVTVTGNTVTGGPVDGIQIIASKTVTVGSNVVRGAGKNGIHAQDSTDVTIAGNTVIDNNQTGPNDCGILIDGTATAPSDIAITGNVVRSTGATKHLHGVRVFTGSNITIVGNAVRGSSGQPIQVDSTGSGIVVGNNVPSAIVGCKAYRTAVQALGDALAATPVQWTSEDYDTNGFHSTSSNTSRFTIPTGQAGTYTVTATVGIATAPIGATDRFILRILVNGSAVKGGGVEIGGNGSAYPSLTITTDLALAAGDYIEAVAYTNTAAAEVEPAVSGMSIRKVA